MDTYETRDLLIASYLYSFDTLQFDWKRNDRGITFCFTPYDVAEDLVKLYFNQNTFNVVPMRLFTSLRAMKDIIFNSK